MHISYFFVNNIFRVSILKNIFIKQKSQLCSETTNSESAYFGEKKHAEILKFKANNNANLAAEASFAFILGAGIYSILEILWRGHTHWTMTITGGLCLTAIWTISRSLKLRLWHKCLISAAVVTAMEFTVGCIVNLLLNWNVWDYSQEPFNILGQICPLFFLYWLGLCLPAVLICMFSRKYIFKQNNK